MKKILFLTLLSLSLNLYSINLNIGLSAYQGARYELVDLAFERNDTLVGYNYGMQLESIYSFSKAALGGGFSFEPGYTLESDEDKVLNQVPIYLLARFNLQPQIPEIFVPYFVIKGGKVFYTGDYSELSSGYLYGSGVGIVIMDTFTVEGLYSFRTIKEIMPNDGFSIFSVSLSYHLF